MKKALENVLQGFLVAVYEVYTALFFSFLLIFTKINYNWSCNENG